MILDEKGGYQMAETEKYGLLLAMLEPPEAMTEEFNDWYDTEHVPERKAIPGFITAQRFFTEEGSPKYLALYDLENIDVLDSEAYRKVGPDFYSPWTRRINRHARIFKRYVYSQISPGKSLLSQEVQSVLVWMNHIPEGKEEEFIHWYEKECLSHLEGLDAFIQARRFRCVEGEANNLSLIEFSDGTFMTNSAYKQALLSDSAAQKRKHFGEAMMKIYEKYSRNQTD